MKKDDKFLIELKDLIIHFAISVLVVILVTQFLFVPVRVDGSSMKPTLEDGQLGFSNVFSIRFLGNIDRFDVVVVDVPNENKKIVKRVIGLPGETIEFNGDVLLINGEKMSEPFINQNYAKEQMAIEQSDYFTQDFGPVTIPEDSYFVMGDNRLNSTDSRSAMYGTFKKESIRSKTVYVFYPFSQIRKAGR